MAYIEYIDRCVLALNIKMKCALKLEILNWLSQVVMQECMYLIRFIEFLFFMIVRI